VSLNFFFEMILLIKRYEHLPSNLFEFKTCDKDWYVWHIKVYEIEMLFLIEINLVVALKGPFCQLESFVYLSKCILQLLFPNNSYQSKLICERKTIWKWMCGYLSFGIFLYQCCCYAKWRRFIKQNQCKKRKKH